MVDLLANSGKRGARVAPCFEGKADADDFERVGEEDRCYACEGAADEAAKGCFLSFVLDDDCAHLFVGKEFDGSVREDA